MTRANAPWPADRTAELVRLWNAGHDTTTIGEMLSVNQRAVQARLRSLRRSGVLLGLTPPVLRRKPAPVWPPSQIAHIILLWNAGQQIKQIATIMRISQSVTERKLVELRTAGLIGYRKGHPRPKQYERLYKPSPTDGMDWPAFERYLAEHDMFDKPLTRRCPRCNGLFQTQRAAEIECPVCRDVADMLG